MSRPPVLAASFVAALLVCVGGCEEGERKFDEPVVVAGDTVPPDTLREGEFHYMRWCAGCHGPEGAGDGPRARAAERPPPDFGKRDWRRAPVSPGELPPDAYFGKVVREGIPGTIMTGMPISDEDLPALITYVKYLSEKGR
ncbi:MAG: c-type cytochrome [Myxococcota bacterium]